MGASQPPPGQAASSARGDTTHRPEACGAGARRRQRRQGPSCPNRRGPDSGGGGGGRVRLGGGGLGGEGGAGAGRGRGGASTRLPERFHRDCRTGNCRSGKQQVSRELETEENKMLTRPLLKGGICEL